MGAYEVVTYILVQISSGSYARPDVLSVSIDKP